MKELMIAALDSTFDQLIKQVPQTKKVTKSISIWDVKPKDLATFMADNNIPDDAYFDGKDNGYDVFDDFLLSWDIIIPMTDDDKFKYFRSSFPAMAFRAISKLLTDNGYKRVGFVCSKLSQFVGMDIYNAYVNKDFDTLLLYYSLHFAKKV